VRPLYTAADLPELHEIGLPGEYPFTRGVYESMYRGRLWTMRQFAGCGTAEETNARFRSLLDHGQTGLSAAFDEPTLTGLDSDDRRAAGRVGVGGVAIDTVDDMAALFGGIDLGDVTVSLAVNGPAPILLAFFVVAAEEQGIDARYLSGTVEADVLKEHIAGGASCFALDPAMRLLGDTVEWCAIEMPRWHPVSVSGYHIREAGATAAQELAFTLKDGLTYVEQAIARGVPVDAFAPQLSFFFSAQMDFFEEIAKYRAARRIWARELRETYGARNPKSWLMRFHTQTAAPGRTHGQEHNNVVRTAIQALAGVLGGTQSLHARSDGEAALQLQQIIAHETGVTNTVDPLGGAYFVEALTDQLEQRAYEAFDRIDALGGMVAAVKDGSPQREIARAAAERDAEIDAGRRVVVGVNRYTRGDIDPKRSERADPALERKQAGRVQAARASRDAESVERTLRALADAAAHRDRNLMPHLIAAARARCSEGEIARALHAVWGEPKTL
jgi:methylmalonyl-CoA mutase N-terminal domain/subunit